MASGQPGAKMRIKKEMLGYLRGTLLQSESGHWILGVGSEAQGWVGYAVQVPQRGSYQSTLPGEAVELFIHTHVREDALDLFGFSLVEEKDLFLTLLSVSGIGPKSGMGILSHVDPAVLLRTIQSRDIAGLTALPGIGKKTAERVILELSESLRKKIEMGAFRSLLQESQGSLSTSQNAVVAGRSSDRREVSQSVLRDAIQALISLGYRENEAQRLLQELLRRDDAPQSVEGLVRLALKQQALS
jgi:Holliday junction DNA helicase RuvA